MSRLRFSLEQAQAEAIRRATEFVARTPNTVRLVCRGAGPDSFAPRSKSSKHPVGWIVRFQISPEETGTVVDGGELFVRVNLETDDISIVEYYG